MSSSDPNLAKVESIAAALGALGDELVFVGGCAVGLLLSDPGAAPARVTVDVDLVVEVTALRAYHEMEAALADRGFTRDQSPDAPICRLRYRNIAVDLMPTDTGILGFANRWYAASVANAERIVLPSGNRIRLIPAPYFLATKFEAYADRGKADVLGSHDLEDIVNVIDGRPELPAEIARSSPELRTYLAERCTALLATPDFDNYLPGFLIQDDTTADRVALLMARLKSIATTEIP